MSRAVCLLVPSDKEIKPEDFKAIIRQSTLKATRKGAGGAGKRHQAFLADEKQFSGVQTGNLYPAWVQTVSLILCWPSQDKVSD